MKKEWTYKKLGDVCGKPSNIKWDEVPKDRMFHYMDLTSVDRETLTINAPQVINSKDAPSRAKQIVRFADVLFATTRPTLKRICIIPKEYDNQICSTGFCILRPNTNILSEWIFYLLLNDNFYNYVEPLQTGANYPAVTDKVIKDYKIPVPPLSEQQEIVSRLDSAFAKIDVVKANAEREIQEAKSLFQKALSEAMMPKEGWEKKEFGEVCSYHKEQGSYKDLPYIGMEHIESCTGRILATMDSNCVLSNTFKFNKGEVLYGRLRPYLKKIYVAEFDGCCSTEVFPIRTEKLEPGFVKYWFLTDEITDRINASAAGCRMPRGNMNDVKKYHIYFPKVQAEQQQIVYKLDTLSEKLKTVEERQKAVMAECDAMKQALLREVFE